jgi:hypothetical protein
LLRLWAEEKVEADDILAKAHDPDALAKKIADARRKMGMGVPLDLNPDEDFEDD